MLSLIRNNVQSFFVKSVISIVALVMLFFGIDSYQNQGVNVLATVGQNEIKLDAFQRALERATEQVRRMYGPNADKLIGMMDLKSQVFSRLVNDALLVETAREQGLAVTDKELAQTLNEIPEFQTDGRFDPKKYQTFLTQIRQSSGAFEDEFRKSLLASKLLALVGQTHLISRSYVGDIYSRNETKLEAELLELSPQDFLSPVKLEPKEIQAYYDQNQAKFQAPARSVVRYFTLAEGDLKEALSIPEKAVELYYKKNKDTEFTKKPSYHARHLLLKVPQDGNVAGTEAARAQAMELYSKLKASPQSFGELAQKFSQDPGSAQKGGDLGWVEEGQLVPIFDREMAQLSPGEVSAPFLSSFGYHIARLEGKKAAQVLGLEEVKGQIEATLMAQKSERRLKNWQAKAQERLATESLETLAKEEHKELTKSPAFDGQSRLPDLGDLTDLSAELEKKPVGTKGVTTLAGRVMAYELLEKIPPQAKPFGEVKTEVELYATQAKEQELVTAKLAHLEGQIKSPADFAALAKSLKQPPKALSFFYKDRKVEGVQMGREFQTQVYGLNPGQVRLVTGQNRNYVVRLVAKTPGSLAGEPKDLLDLERELNEQKSQILVSGLIDQKRKNAKVSYNDKLLKTLEIKRGA
ncbi:MAG: hypothetical protein A2600_01900 [Candidatus Lambdaproteobacteria bacterium RIFOXYD1_FULL_56_27]|uniref:Periplasmic chaperone PpiD n=1 Tax=Candidatus Lambdaproteobacteria bacterium RIFOXYD2_FULL_56_26 TaxID=1817773 RepID=A0A1F6GMT8_9PROT|nr:MAG: hypothetical protein A2557_12530 [Candidatus Lambdaproteobacteria bacterium RIFOXYD2_FULL_56_26]OGH05593.1 MAG: hypothetical protein A2426_04690 [Candidatus Lambdaproteobacteria bacterium RIFOXYC1_FULL_56_13]OGH08553.1 MAG: hypothetical protein A2600_01900 [Candidatus Lambdaproteobacteria bacterium RIFOXYD1_FULL_56_27]